MFNYGCICWLRAPAQFLAILTLSVGALRSNTPFRVSGARILKAETLAAMLVKNGMIDIAAIEDPEGYDNWRTWNAIRDVASEITKAANTKVSSGDEPR